MRGLVWVVRDVCVSDAVNIVPDSSGFLSTVESRTFVVHDSLPLVRLLVQHTCLLCEDFREIWNLKDLWSLLPVVFLIHA